MSPSDYTAPANDAPAQAAGRMPPGSSSPRPRSARRRFGRRMLIRFAVVVGLVAILRLTGCMDRAYFHPASGPTPAPPGAEDVWFESGDGTRLYGWWFPARNHDAAAGHAPTILHAHGNAGNIRDHLWFTDYLPQAGFNLFIFDYRGYGQSAGTARRRGGLIADADAALDSLLSRPDVDPDRIGLYGQSLGGSIGVVIMHRRPEIAAAVLESPFDSWRRIAANVVGGDPPHFLGRALAWMLVSDADSPLDSIAGIDRPILILHGDADSVIPLSHGRRLAEASGGSAELMILADGDHNSLKETHPEIEDAVIEFFRRHLVGPPPGRP